MRPFYLLIILTLVLGCKESRKKENQNHQGNDLKILWTVDWQPNQNQIITGGMQDTLRLISTKNLKTIKNYPYKGTITKSKWHPSKNKVATSVQDGVSKLTIINFDTNERITLDSITNDGARAIGWNKQGNLLAVGDYEGYLTFFDEFGRFIKKVDTHQKSLIGLDWHPEEELIVTVGEKITLYHYGLDSIQHINDRNEEIEVLMLCTAWHPSGKFFVTGDYGDFTYHFPPLLQYWTYDGKRIKSIEKSESEYRNLKWSSDGKILATASEKIRLWDKNGNLIHEKAAPRLLWGVDWNGNNDRLVTTDEEGKITFWDKKLNKINEVNF